MTILFRLLGRVQVDSMRGALLVRSAPVRGVLAALLLEEGRFVPVDHLLRALWDDPPTSARQNLRLHIARLREQLSELSLRDRLTTLRGGGGGYHLRLGPEELDTVHFKRLAEKGGSELRAGLFTEAEGTLRDALLLWRGPIGQDCTASHQLRSRFQAYGDLQLTVRERLTEARIGLGAAGDLIPEIQEVLAVAPFRERSWANLIRAHYLGGDVSGALAAWDRAMALFLSELGLDLSLRLRGLHISILRGDDEAIRLGRRR